MALRAPAQPDVHGRLLSDRADADTGAAVAEPPTSAAADLPPRLDDLAARLGHRFHRIGLLREALTHPSVDPKQRGKARHGYQRLEFLGDRVLGLVMAKWLLERFPKEDEGAIGRRFAALVQRDMVADVARRAGVGAHLILAEAVASSGGRDNSAILGDVGEAVIGALYLDGGLAPAEAFIRVGWADRVDEHRRPPQDAKSAVQQWALGRGLPLPRYVLVSREGPDHQPRFEIRIEVKGKGSALGVGATKQEAERAAATALLAELPK